MNYRQGPGKRMFRQLFGPRGSLGIVVICCCRQPALRGPKDCALRRATYPNRRGRRRERRHETSLAQCAGCPDRVRAWVSESLSGIISSGRDVLGPRSAGLPGCPRVTATVPDRPPDRARVGHCGHDLVIRSSGQAVRNRPGTSMLWADVPGLSAHDRCRPEAWQQCWLQFARDSTSSLSVLGPWWREGSVVVSKCT